MELLCTLLTGFSLWLLVFHWRRKSIAQVRQLAGELVYRAKSPRPRRMHWAWFVCLLLLLIPSLAAQLAGRHTLVSEFSLALSLSVVLLLGIPARANTLLEVRGRGILCSKYGDRNRTRPFMFTPWNQIATYQWVPKSFGAIGRLDDTHGRFTLAEDAIALDQKANITAAIGRFVPVYDNDGALLARPEAGQEKQKPAATREFFTTPFQFDLQTMLLLVVAVACAANLYGIRYRSPHYQALMKLGTCNPKISYNRDDVLGLDFSTCVKKPTDADMADLEPLVELESLDLSGAPITDAGLEHLKALKNLRSVNVSNTNVTSEGIEDLGRSLPHGRIFREHVTASDFPAAANGN
jgi:hypothetical protein